MVHGGPKKAGSVKITTPEHKKTIPRLVPTMTRRYRAMIADLPNTRAIR